MPRRASDKIRVLLVDDQLLFRRGLEFLLPSVSNKIEVVRSLDNGKEAVEFCKENPVDVILMDIEMPIMDGLEATRKIVTSNPNQNVIMLTMHDEPKMVQHCIEIGAKGFLPKSVDIEELIDAIMAVNLNGYYLSNKISKSMITLLTKKEENARIILSDREKAVIKLICEEQTMREIADKLSVSSRTVEMLRTRILEKTKAKNTVGIVMYALKNKIVQ